MECNQCYKVFTRSDNLRRHMKIHDRYHPYPNSSQENVIAKNINSQPNYCNDRLHIPNPSEDSEIMKSIRPLFQSEIRRKPFIQKSYSSQNLNGEEDRLERLEVLNGDIDYIIEQSVEKMKEEIWNCMAESHEFEEKERKGGSLTEIALRELKENHGIDLLYNKVNEMKEAKEEEETYVDEVAEEIFREVVSKDKK